MANPILPFVLDYLVLWSICTARKKLCMQSTDVHQESGEFWENVQHTAWTMGYHLCACYSKLRAV